MVAANEDEDTLRAIRQRGWKREMEIGRRTRTAAVAADDDDAAAAPNIREEKSFDCR
jgi:hypothetical protein